MDNLALYNAVKQVPDNAMKKITGGRLKGMTDINPMWRFKALTEQFGPCGFGWRYEITEKRLEQGGNNEVAAFVDINLYVNIEGEWSAPIPGTGGSSFVAKESKGLYTSDECFKMALTDAISVACKALGVGADVYWNADTTKYNRQDNEKLSTEQSQPTQAKPADADKCSDCNGGVTKNEVAYSMHHFKKPLCRQCQAKAKEGKASA